MKYEDIQVNDCCIRIPIPSSYNDAFELVRSDWFRLNGRKPSKTRMLLGLRNYHTAFLFWLRFSSYKGILYPICRRFLNYYSRKYSLLIEPETKIGYGLYLGHFCNIVINPTAIIGNNVNLSQFTTIGSNEGAAAIIGDQVYIGPNVCTVENIIIGFNSTIGAGSVVVKNVPQDVTVAGVPAKIISYKKPARFIKNIYSPEN